VVVQYLSWLGKALTGDFGESFGQQRPVRMVIGGKIGATLRLALGAWLFAIGVGVPMGVLAAVRRATVWDYLGRGFALFGQALPVFWTGIMSILIFSVMLDWLPAGTRGDYRGFPLAWENVKYHILPSLVLGWPAAAGIMRLTRSAMLEVLDSEYVKFARAKGVSEFTVIWKHALKNSLIPPLTAAMLLLAGYLNGAVITETIFSWPGIGWLALKRAVYDNDFPLLLGCVFVFVGIYLFFSFLADILYAFVDPRIRYQ
jgi:peptide/nickel transport system permease protein